MALNPPWPHISVTQRSATRLQGILDSGFQVCASICRRKMNSSGKLDFSKWDPFDRRAAQPRACWNDPAKRAAQELTFRRKNLPTGGEGTHSIRTRIRFSKGVPQSWK